MKETTQTDPHLWLEGIDDKDALDWVRSRNAQSLETLEKLPGYPELLEQNLAAYNAPERIAWPVIRGRHIYNFWKDSKHERGLWRRTTLDEYSREAPAWETVLDLDALARDEDENWIWAGSTCLAPDYQHCLVKLSRGGSDAVVTREFDLTTCRFVNNGFELPESKCSSSFLDKDTLLVATNFGDGSMTGSGYPRILKAWKRGQPLEDAELIHSGKSSDIGVFSVRMHTPEQDYNLVYSHPTFFTTHYYLFYRGNLKRLSLPEDAELETIFQGQLVVSLKSDWVLDGHTWLQGSLVGLALDELLADEIGITLIHQPDRHSAVSEVSRTRDFLLLNQMRDVRSELLAYSRQQGQWQMQAIDTPDMGHIELLSSSRDNNDFFFSYTDFLTPTVLYQGHGQDKPAGIRSLPEFFDSSGYAVSQHFATSRDGTRVPYFMVAPRNLEPNGQHPTLIYAYGGFESSVTPNYSPTIGIDWLSRGGVYVVANIRGGGEYGPAWHRAAQRENRQKSYDDFYAVTEDLIERGVSRPEHLGIMGGSGGGLLVGMLFVQRPELFKAVVCMVPLLDMQRYHRLLAGASWVEEYGDPDNPEDWKFLQHYSPYHGLKPDQAYPSIFLTTSTRDDRVHPGHARKMAARMQAMGIPHHYYENIEGGHGGAANHRQSAQINALVYSFLASELFPAD